MRKGLKYKRRFRRFATMGMVRLQQSTEDRGKEAYIANISRDGIGLYTRKQVSPGETYYIRPMSWDNLDELWAAKAVWCKVDGDCIMAGFRFTSMTDQGFDHIKKRLFLSSIP
jgi:hypothetical protein